MLDKDPLKQQLMTRRAFIIGLGKLGVLFLLACRMFYMQFLKKDEYRTLSDKNRIRIIIVPPIRGQIFDRNNKILAKNKPCFRLMLEKSGNPGYPNEIKLVSNLLELNEEQKLELQKKVKKAGHRVPAVIIDCLEWEELSILEERKPDFKAVFIDMGYERYYPEGLSCAHLIGYLGSSQEKIIDENFKIGQNGLEKHYDAHLQGEFGHKQLEVNAYGNYVRSLATSASSAGEDLHLNIDSRLQAKIMPLLNITGCSVVLMDCKDGGIITLNSAPGFEPNNFNKLSRIYWKDLISNPHYPLVNKAIQGAYPPGSIFKIITVLAALEAGHNPSQRIYCAGKPFLGGNSFRCAKREGHGWITLKEAITTSCNSYIYSIAREVGADRIINMAKKFGFGHRTDIDLPGEKKGFLPSKEWKQKRLNSKWTLGDTFNLAIGQGYTLVTPLQLARFMATLASGGRLYKPQIAKGESKFTNVNVNPEHIAYINSTLYEVINGIGGTGYLSRIGYKKLHMAGKTSTAQVIAKKDEFDNLSRADIAWARRNHASFAGFAPYHDPKYAVCVYYEHGGSGGRAASPIAKQIIEMALAFDI